MVFISTRQNCYKLVINWQPVHYICDIIICNYRFYRWKILWCHNYFGIIIMSMEPVRASRRCAHPEASLQIDVLSRLLADRGKTWRATDSDRSDGYTVYGLPTLGLTSDIRTSGNKLELLWREPVDYQSALLQKAGSDFPSVCRFIDCMPRWLRVSCRHKHAFT